MRRLIYTLPLLIAAALLPACRPDAFERVPEEYRDASPDTTSPTTSTTDSTSLIHYSLSPTASSTSPIHSSLSPTTSLPPGQNRRISINRIGNLREIFNDSNKYHYEYAERLGINPIATLADAYYTRRPVVKIETCDLYFVDSLTHSLPFLVPEAEKLLNDIGRNFIDSLRRRGASGHRIRVTSLLRTERSVRRLRRVNRNATDSSTHQFGTTFDISYSRFDAADSLNTIHQEDLKNLLAEVLNDLRNQGRCLVKFESKSPCFHITAIR